MNTTIFQWRTFMIIASILNLNELVYTERMMDKHDNTQRPLSPIWGFQTWNRTTWFTQNSPWEYSTIYTSTRPGLHRCNKIGSELTACCKDFSENQVLSLIVLYTLHFPFRNGYSSARGATVYIHISARADSKRLISRAFKPQSWHISLKSSRWFWESL